MDSRTRTVAVGGGEGVKQIFLSYHLSWLEQEWPVAWHWHGAPHWRPHLSSSESVTLQSWKPLNKRRAEAITCAAGAGAGGRLCIPQSGEWEKYRQACETTE